MGSVQISLSLDCHQDKKIARLLMGKIISHFFRKKGHFEEISKLTAQLQTTESTSSTLRQEKNSLKKEKRDKSSF